MQESAKQITENTFFQQALFDHAKYIHNYTANMLDNIKSMSDAEKVVNLRDLRISSQRLLDNLDQLMSRAKSTRTLAYFNFEQLEAEIESTRTLLSDDAPLQPAG